MRLYAKRKNILSTTQTIDKKEICVKMKVSILIDGDEVFVVDTDVGERNFRGKEEECQMIAAISGIDSVDFALYLNEKLKERGKSANKTKMQKLLYICYGSYLKMHDMQQLLDEKPSAWDYGPAFPNVYHAQKSNRNGLDGLQALSPEKLKYFKIFDDLIDGVIDFFGDWTAEQLIDWTHEADTAWHKKYNKKKDRYTSLNNLDILMDFNGYMT